MQILKKEESKLLGRTYVEAVMEGRGGQVSRKDAVSMLASELGVPAENVGLVRIDGQVGTTDVVGRFYVYGSAESMKATHPEYLSTRMLTKEEKEKLKADKKKAASPAPAPEEKK